MKLLMLTILQDVEESRFLIDVLKGKAHEVTLLFLHDEMKKTLKEDLTYFDFLLIDYNYYNHVRYNLLWELSRMGCSAPVVFYNDPQIKKTSSAFNYWYSIILEYYYTNENELMKYKRFLYEFEEAVLKWDAKCIEVEKEKELQRYFEYFMKGIVPNNSIHQVSANESQNQNANQEDKLKLILNKLKASSYVIFKKLTDNLNECVKETELSQLIKKPGKSASHSTIACSISNIRKVLKENNINDLRITKCGESYMLSYE